MELVTIIPLSKILKDLSKQYSFTWKIEDHAYVPDSFTLETLAKIHNNGTQAFRITVKEGIDFEFKED